MTQLYTQIYIKYISGYMILIHKVLIGILNINNSIIKHHFKMDRTWFLTMNDSMEYHECA
ncbi:unnamed protein product [Paramecium octaurelia]|uniref:Uncharacterized protein n=1 Tax=Paramecium octaurelia TaxID=43137 RepID=A0A8S1YGG1_PAROT|nr:unnamed protein product [Paramecium octaurelia]